jgi:Fic family protein
VKELYEFINNNKTNRSGRGKTTGGKTRCPEEWAVHVQLMTHMVWSLSSKLETEADILKIIVEPYIVILRSLLYVAYLLFPLL